LNIETPAMIAVAPQRKSRRVRTSFFGSSALDIRTVLPPNAGHQRRAGTIHLNFSRDPIM
jgi:hypothetical protein